MAVPKLPVRAVRRPTRFPLFPFLAALLLVVLGVQAFRMLTALNVVDEGTVPKLASNPSVFETLERVHPKSAMSVTNLRPVRVVVPAFGHNVQVGDSVAPHVVTVLNDPLCGPCREAVVRMLRGIDSERYRVVYKYWPRDATQVEAGLIMAMAQQHGKGEPVMKALMARGDTLSAVDLLGLVDVAGLNLSVQRVFLAEHGGELTEQVGRDVAQGQDAGVGPPPQVVVDDYLIDGRVLYPGRLGVYMDRLDRREALVQARDYWLNAGE